jgi:hypothetical protein
MQQLETKMDEWFVKKAPIQIPESGRTGIVKIMPWLTLVGGILMLWAAWHLYQIATIVTTYTSYLYSTTAGYYTPPATASVTLVMWISIFLLALEGLLFFIAFPALRARKKSGWNLLFWVALLHVVYALVYLFSDMQVFSFIFSLASSTVGLYFLFQIRSHYMGVASPAAHKPATPTHTAPTDITTPDRQ